MTDIPDELVDRGAAALHQACIDRWAQIPPGTHAGITKHPPEAHRDQARTVLESVVPEMYERIRRALEGERRFATLEDERRKSDAGEDMGG